MYIQEWLQPLKSYKKSNQIYQKQNQKNHQKRVEKNLKKWKQQENKEENSIVPQKANVKLVRNM